MPTYEKCDESVKNLAESLIAKHKSYELILKVGVRIDLVFAYALKDANGDPKGCALKKNGVRAFGITRIIPVKDRAQGRGDVEIALDGDFWSFADPAKQTALLDHELYHIIVVTDNDGNIQYDSHSRPKIRMRQHDVDIGWFKDIAQRHGINSLEQIQAKMIMDKHGQFFWPDIAPPLLAQGIKPKKAKGIAKSTAHAI